MAGLQSPREVVWPAVVRVGARANAVGDRVAERNDCADVASRAPHFNRGGEVPRDRAGPESLGLAVKGVVSGGHVVDLFRSPVLRRRSCWPGQVDAHGKVLERAHGQPDRVAEDLTAGRDHGIWLAVERERRIAPIRDGGARQGRSERGAGDPQRPAPKGIAEPDTCPAPARAREDNIAHSLVLETERERGPRDCRLRTRAPPSDPAGLRSKLGDAFPVDAGAI